MHKYFKTDSFKLKLSNMLLDEKLRKLRTDAGQPQRRVAAALDIDTGTYCKIEKGKFLPSKEQITMLSVFYKCDKTELLKLLLADKLIDVAKDEELASEAFVLAQDMLNRKK